MVQERPQCRHTAAGIKERLLSLMDDTFQAAGLLDESPQREGGLAVVDALLASKERCIPASVWRDKLPAREHQEELSRSGVVHFDGKEVGRCAAVRGLLLLLVKNNGYLPMH